MTHPYASAAYVEALAAAEGGRCIDVPEWSCPVILRPIRGGFDAAGPYPRTPLPASARLADGLARLRETGAMSVVLAPDPMSAPEPAALAAAFEHCRPFKTHFVIDRRAPGEWPSKHHRYKIRKARRACDIEVSPLSAALGDWARLYRGLAERRAISGPADFTPDYFRALGSDPAYEAIVARRGGRVVAMAIWFVFEDVAVYHLGASDPDGYAIGASYAIFDAAIERFDVHRFDLGGAAGLNPSPDDGLARFKRGFANSCATAHICGAILDAAAYERLAGGAPSADFFPAYRAPIAA